MKKTFPVFIAAIILLIVFFSCNNKPVIPEGSPYKRGYLVYSIDRSGLIVDNVTIDESTPTDREITISKEENKIIILDVQTGKSDTYSIQKVFNQIYYLVNGGKLIVGDTSIVYSTDRFV